MLTEFLIICFSVSITKVWSSCPAATYFSDNTIDVLPTEHIKTFADFKTTFETYIDAPSYDKYETQCHQFNQQPPSVSDVNLKNAYRQAIGVVKEYVKLDQRAKFDSRAQNFSRELVRIEYSDMYLEATSRYLQQTRCMSKKSSTLYLPSVRLDKYRVAPPANYTEATCEFAAAARGHQKLPSCSTTFPYRTYDGTCNNLERPLLGKTNDCQRRLLPADYSDGISALRTAIDGSPLPNPRVLSLDLLGQEDKR